MRTNFLGQGHGKRSLFNFLKQQNVDWNGLVDGMYNFYRQTRLLNEAKPENNKTYLPGSRWAHEQERSPRQPLGMDQIGDNPQCLSCRNLANQPRA